MNLSFERCCDAVLVVAHLERQAEKYEASQMNTATRRENSVCSGSCQCAENYMARTIPRGHGKNCGSRSGTNTLLAKIPKLIHERLELDARYKRDRQKDLMPHASPAREIERQSRETLNAAWRSIGRSLGQALRA